jgi:predicted GIY-YIG superfamily endonuclease
MAHPQKNQRWFVYILECGDGTLYTGVSNNVAARIAAHRAGKGAKYTRGRQPLRVVCTISCRNKSAALKNEYAIKKLSRDEKLALIKKHNHCG